MFVMQSILFTFMVPWSRKHARTYPDMLSKIQSCHFCWIVWENITEIKFFLRPTQIMNSKLFWYGGTYMNLKDSLHSCVIFEIKYPIKFYEPSVATWSFLVIFIKIIGPDRIILVRHFAITELQFVIHKWSNKTGSRFRTRLNSKLGFGSRSNWVRISS